MSNFVDYGRQGSRRQWSATSVYGRVGVYSGFPRSLSLSLVERMWVRKSW